MAVAYARELGYQRIAAVGFSMGSSVVLRHAGLIGGVDAVVSISGPGRWYYRGTERMRRVHYAVEHRLGRFVTRHWLKTRISPEGWKLVPVPPAEAAAKIAPVPLLIVHGDQDPYFPPEHARQLYLAAREPKELWLIPGMGHAEVATRQRPHRPHRPLARPRRPRPRRPKRRRRTRRCPRCCRPARRHPKQRRPHPHHRTRRTAGRRLPTPRATAYPNPGFVSSPARAAAWQVCHGWRVCSERRRASSPTPLRPRNVSDDQLSTRFVNEFLTVAAMMFMAR